MGAWIEIGQRLIKSDDRKSLPSWERGLKSAAWNVNSYLLPSLPSWERGLKYKRDNNQCIICKVAPFMGAWIEIHSALPKCQSLKGRSLHGSVDWNMYIYATLFVCLSRSLHGSVDWNKTVLTKWCWKACRSLHGSVDWNFIAPIADANARVAPFNVLMQFGFARSRIISTNQNRNFQINFNKKSYGPYAFVAMEP